jgi:2,4-dienoyl-CoA reductase-like NADH-dependent reductase (Old Yellow Enzyme family)
VQIYRYYRKERADRNGNQEARFYREQQNYQRGDILMAEHGRFNYRNTDELLADAEKLGLKLSLQEDLSPLTQPLELRGHTIPNRLAILPVEGRDFVHGGKPGELSYRRYERYARGGAGLIWFEAGAVWHDGSSSDNQMLLSPENMDEIKKLLEHTRKSASGEFGQNHRPLCLMQLTDSGRYRKATGTTPGLVARYPLLDERVKGTKDTPLMTDDDIQRVMDEMVAAAVRSWKAGFDGVDIKGCHRYLSSELLAAFTRENSRFGGSFENRIRFFTEIADRIRELVDDPSFIISMRLNIYDSFPYPYGWGVDREDPSKIDLTEPFMLIEEMEKRDLSLLGTTLGTPYYCPWVNRPFDRVIPGNIDAPEHPLEGVVRALDSTGKVQKQFPEVKVVGAMYSWLRQFSAQAAAAQVASGKVSMAGFGRMGLAYPDFAKDILEKGKMDPRKVCITCSLCSQVMAKGGQVGCYIRDREVYTQDMLTPYL